MFELQNFMLPEVVISILKVHIVSSHNQQMNICVCLNYMGLSETDVSKNCVINEAAYGCITNKADVN